METQIAQHNTLANKLSLWKDRLIDFGHTNKLLYFGKGKGYAEVPSELENMLLTLFTEEKKSVVFKPDLMDERLLKRIERKARENAEERGLATLNIAIGLINCENPAEQDTICAPIILVPIQLENRAIEAAGDPFINPILIAFLKRHEISLESTVWMWQEVTSTESLIASWAQSLPPSFAYTIEPKMVLGNFWFQGMEMALDLEDHQEDLLSHQIVRALIGDENARISLNHEREPIVLRELDKRPSHTDFLILDADSSQRQVIAAVEKGQSGVIQGPPGTGKSQTLANIIATLLANKKSVLFIAEKKAAIDVIEERLRQCGLDHLCMNLHGMQLSRKSVWEHIRKAIQHAQSYAMVQTELRPYADLDRLRNDLNQHVHQLHSRREGPDMSLHMLREHAHSCSEYELFLIRWAKHHLLRWNVEVRRQIEEIMRRLNDIDIELRRAPGNVPQLPKVDQERIYLKYALDWIGQYGRVWYGSVSLLCNELTLTRPTTFQEVVTLLEHLNRQYKIQQIAHSEVFSSSLQQLQNAISSDQATGWFGHHQKRLFNDMYRSAWKELTHLFPRQPRHLIPSLIAEAIAVQQWYRQHNVYSVPILSPSYVHIIEGWPAVYQTFHIASFYQDEQLILPLEEFIMQCQHTIATIGLLEQRESILQRLHDEGLAEMIYGLQQSQIPVEKWYEYFLHLWSKSWCTVLETEDPSIVQRYASMQERTVSDFQRIDRAIFRQNASRINQQQAEHCLVTMRAYPNEMSYLSRFIPRVRKLPSLTTILQNAPHVMQALFPCVMASPLVVSQMLKVAPKYFDLVLVDEASQILPEHAIMSIMRGKQTVVAGDRYQLPPTTFFVNNILDEGSEREENDDDVGAYESLLDLMTGIFPMEWHLRWHYRSRDEKLIAFSNRTIYGDQLVTFPGTSTTPAVQLKLVKALEGSRSGSPEEVREVLDLIKTFAHDHPDESLGVITLGVTYALVLQQALDSLCKGDDVVARYCDEARSPRFFIKSIEQVQGDERDHIILAIGYGKGADGRMRYLFGPINRKGGERRLNVAVTRARATMIVVSSFSHLDMAPDKTDHSNGLRFLRQYLAYADSNGKDLQQAQISHVEMNVFERDIYEKLRSRSIHLIPQVGVSQYRIDFAVMHPERPGEYLMALECDGASYHSVQTARDRDRLRQQVLESLGWHFYRIWSTDWFHRQEREIDRFMEHYKCRLANENLRPKIAHQEPVLHQSPLIFRSPKPNWIGNRAGISQYRDDEIIDVLRWIESDKKARLDEELKLELMDALGFSRRTAKMNEVFSRCIGRYHHLTRTGI